MGCIVRCLHGISKGIDAVLTFPSWLQKGGRKDLLKESPAEATWCEAVKGSFPWLATERGVMISSHRSS